MDLIAVLTLPAVAAGHLVLQVRGLLDQHNDPPMTTSVDENYIQSVAAIEASFFVTKTFMPISVFMFMIAAWMFCIRRAIFVALIGLLCFAAEYYIVFSRFGDLGLRYDPGVLPRESPAFSRFFVPDVVNSVIAILVTILFIIGLLNTAIVLFILVLPKTLALRGRQDIERVVERVPRERMLFQAPTQVADGPRSDQLADRARQSGRSDGLHMRSITLVTMLILPSALISSILPLFWHSAVYSTVTSPTLSSWQAFLQDAARFGQGIFPRTACSIVDLDQMVAAAAGAAVLGFRVYSVVKAYFTEWNSSRTPDTEPTGVELNRVERPRVS